MADNPDALERMIAMKSGPGSLHIEGKNSSEITNTQRGNPCSIHVCVQTFN